ncbi:hypothetical protein BaRGS_00021930 [Batillaria attramentaria]|uniref:Uncharacterized protein n=1 Tax=Batillaria attramentaria TaxID=370345 RepID=A0ABD0KI86_9CAEN
MRVVVVVDDEDGRNEYPRLSDSFQMTTLMMMIVGCTNILSHGYVFQMMMMIAGLANIPSLGYLPDDDDDSRTSNSPPPHHLGPHTKFSLYLFLVSKHVLQCLLFHGQHVETWLHARQRMKATRATIARLEDDYKLMRETRRPGPFSFGLQFLRRGRPRLRAHLHEGEQQGACTPFPPDSVRRDQRAA